MVIILNIFTMSVNESQIIETLILSTKYLATYQCSNIRELAASLSSFRFGLIDHPNAQIRKLSMVLLFVCSSRINNLAGEGKGLDTNRIKNGRTATAPTLLLHTPLLQSGNFLYLIPLSKSDSKASTVAHIENVFASKPHKKLPVENAVFSTVTRNILAPGESIIQVFDLQQILSMIDTAEGCEGIPDPRHTASFASISNLVASQATHGVAFHELSTFELAVLSLPTVGDETRKLVEQAKRNRSQPVGGSRVSESPTREKRTEPARSKLSVFAAMNNDRESLFKCEVPIIIEAQDKLEHSLRSEGKNDFDSTDVSLKSLKNSYLKSEQSSATKLQLFSPSSMRRIRDDRSASPISTASQSSSKFRLRSKGKNIIPEKTCGSQKRVIVVNRQIPQMIASPDSRLNDTSRTDSSSIVLIAMVSSMDSRHSPSMESPQLHTTKRKILLPKLSRQLAESRF